MRALKGQTIRFVTPVTPGRRKRLACTTVEATVSARSTHARSKPEQCADDRLSTSSWMKKSHGLRIQDPWLQRQRELRVYVGRAILLPVFGKEGRVIV
jgi:hypothetical protein